MARLPDHLTAPIHGVTHHGDRIVVEIRADVSQYVARLRVLSRWTDRLAAAGPPRLSAMHRAYDVRRRARRRRTRR